MLVAIGALAASFRNALAQLASTIGALKGGS